MSDPIVSPSTASDISVGGRRVRYAVSGAGPSVVMLHGIGRSLEDWSEQHELLADRFRVYSVDLAGFDNVAVWPPAGAQPDAGKARADFFDSLFHSAAVVGINTSALIEAAILGKSVLVPLAVQAPHRVASLVLVDSAGFGREVTLTLRLLAIRPLGRLLLRRPSRLGARQVERSLFDDPALATDARIDHAYRLAQRPHAARVLLETGRNLGTLRGVRPEWRQRLLKAVAELEVPILVVWGSNDRILPAKHLNAAAARLPHARTHLFEDTGHMPQIERARAFSDLVTDFWRPRE